MAVGAGFALGTTARTFAATPGANGDIRVGMIGVGNKGGDHIENAKKIAGVRIVAVCDVDPTVLAQRVKELKDDGIDVFATTDARKLIERADVDAVVIASCNHWHALHTVWACEAGKDVYVEKPVSHSVWEGIRMVRAKNRYGRVVQAGTQLRSDISMPHILEYLREGHLGKIQFVRALCFKPREGIGRKLPWYPDWLDFDMYCGPAPMDPLVRNKLHYDWHWFWDTGNGDLGNLGIHEVDVGRWIAGHEGGPKRVLSVGGRFVFDDTGQTPNTQLTFFDYGSIPVFLENRVLPVARGASYMDHVYGVRQGVYVQCEGGFYAGRYGGWVYDNNGKRLQQFKGDGGANHLPNFFNAVRNRRPEDLACPIETGRISTATCLYGNISYRLGRKAGLGEVSEMVASIPEAAPILEGFGKHLTANGVDVDKPNLTLGRWIDVDDGVSGVTKVEEGDATELEWARFQLRGVQRPNWELKEQT